MSLVIECYTLYIERRSVRPFTNWDSSLGFTILSHINTDERPGDRVWHRPNWYLISYSSLCTFWLPCLHLCRIKLKIKDAKNNNNNSKNYSLTQVWNLSTTVIYILGLVLPIVKNERLLFLKSVLLTFTLFCPILMEICNFGIFMFQDKNTDRRWNMGWKNFEETTTVCYFLDERQKT